MMIPDFEPTKKQLEIIQREKDVIELLKAAKEPICSRDCRKAIQIERETFRRFMVKMSKKHPEIRIEFGGDPITKRPTKYYSWVQDEKGGESNRCIYCDVDFDYDCTDVIIKDEIPVFPADGSFDIEIETYISRGELVLGSSLPRSDFMTLKKVKINYCPICGRKL